MKLGYHASHEQFAPGELLEMVLLAEQAGFNAVMCSDHFSPWSEQQGHSGFAWGWLGAALSRTQLSFGCVTAPGYRYHPAVVAQAAATFADMYPGRFWLALGSGEFLNEHITGRPWPSREQRVQNLLAAVDSIRRLLQGAEVTRGAGASYVDRARVWVTPAQLPKLLGAALSVESASTAAAWADGLIIAATDVDRARQLVGSYREAGGSGPVFAQLAIGFAEDDALALREAHERWRQVALRPEELSDLATAQEFDAATHHITPEAVRDRVFVSSRPSDYVALLKDYADIGVHTVYVHNVCRDQVRFITAFGREVLPALQGVAA